MTTLLEVSNASFGYGPRRAVITVVSVITFSISITRARNARRYRIEKGALHA